MRSSALETRTRLAPRLESALHGALPIALIAALIAHGGCKRSAGPTDEADAEADAAPPEIRVHPDNPGLAFRYFDKSQGVFRTVGSIDEVPSEVRPAVLVFDASAPAPPPEVLYVADLSSPREDGSFPWRTVERYAYEQGIAFVPDGASRDTKPQVTVYSAEWCGACKKAMKWLRGRGIAYVERDVEKDPKALRDMAEDARRAGVDPASLGGGVPVIVVGDQIFSGFSPSAIERALGR